MARNSSVRERVVRIARQQFLRHGFYNISMDSLVKELRTSKSSVYNHFVSKEALVKEILIDVNSEINLRLEQTLKDDKLTFKGKLVTIADFTRQVLTEVSDMFLSDLEAHAPRLWDEYQRMRTERINKYYKALFKIGIKQGLVRSDINLEVIVAVYMSLTKIALEHRQVAQLGLPHEKIYDNVTDIFLNGIMKSS